MLYRGTATILSKRSGQADGPEGEAALRIVRQCAMQLVKRNGENYKSQEISNTIWSFATIGYGLKGGSTADTGNDYTFLQSNDIEGDMLLMADTVKVAISTAKQIIFRFRSQELNNLAWAMARLGQKDEEILTMIGRELANPRRKVLAQDIGTTLWAFATLEFFDDSIYRQIVKRTNWGRASYTKPQELSNGEYSNRHPIVTGLETLIFFVRLVLWALATADITPKYLDSFDTLLRKSARTPPHVAERDPVTYIVAIASQELMRRPQDFKPQEIKDSLWSLSRVCSEESVWRTSVTKFAVCAYISFVVMQLGIRYPPLFKAVALHLVGPADDAKITGRGLEGFSPQSIGNLAWAYARQAQLASNMSIRRKDDMLIAAMTGRLAQYSISFVDLGESLLQKLFYAIAETDLNAYGEHE